MADTFHGYFTVYGKIFFFNFGYTHDLSYASCPKSHIICYAFVKDKNKKETKSHDTH